MTYVISDIHGNYNQFEKMLKKIKFNSSDKMYILGDVIDRGTEPIRLLKKISQMENVFLVIGNHEVMMLNAYAKKPNAYGLWYMNGGEVTDEQFEQLEPDEQDKLLGYLMSSYLVIPNLVVNNRHFYLTHSTHLSRPIKTPVMYKDNGENRPEVLRYRGSSDGWHAPRVLSGNRQIYHRSNPFR